MKKITLSAGLIFSLSLLGGCGYKTGCGVDNCREPHINSCDNKCITNNSTQSTCNKCQNISKQPVYPKKIIAKPAEPILPKNTPLLKCNEKLRISVTGEGVAPCKGACSPAQSYALAKRAAIADAYRLLAEKIKGVYVQGDDYIKNMAVKRSIVRTYVSACIRNANITDTTFKDGLCEVEMDITLSHSDFAQ